MKSVVLILAITLAAQSPEAETSAWKTYHNVNYNFEVKYPAGWSIYEGFTKNGVTISPGEDGEFRLRPQIGAGGSVGQPSEADEKRIQNLEEDFQSRLNAVKQNGYARNLTVVSKTNEDVQGLPAIESTVSYEDSTGQTWLYRQILIHSDDDETTYHLSLRYSADDAVTLVPLFDAMCRTLRILESSGKRGVRTQSNIGQTENQATAESCRKFVQNFYDWYVSNDTAATISQAPLWDVVLTRKPEVLSSELRQRLEKDRDAGSKCKGEICSLDFDPFLFTQDPSAHFEAFSVRRKGSKYWVDVYGMESGRRREHVMPELVLQDNHWTFLNFHYGKDQWSNDSNLLSILEKLEAYRMNAPQPK
jgi:hypothetical protein